MCLVSCDVIKEKKINCDWLDLAVTSTNIYILGWGLKCGSYFLRAYLPFRVKIEQCNSILRKLD
jgi:hypothetical protein